MIAMILSFDICLELCNIISDSRCLFLTCKYLYTANNDKRYWSARGVDRIKYWLPKIKAGVPFTGFAAYGNLEMVKHLVSLGADCTSENNYAVQVASEHGHLEVVKYLVSVGADITECNDRALRLASEHGHLEVVKYLVSIGADITINDNIIMRRASQNGHLEVVKYLVSLGINVASSSGNDALGRAYFNRRLEVAKYLLSQGAR